MILFEEKKKAVINCHTKVMKAKEGGIKVWRAEA
jgi:hypothetical protein